VPKQLPGAPPSQPLLKLSHHDSQAVVTLDVVPAREPDRSIAPTTIKPGVPASACGDRLISSLVLPALNTITQPNPFRPLVKTSLIAASTTPLLVPRPHEQLNTLTPENESGLTKALPISALVLQQFN